MIIKIDTSLIARVTTSYYKLPKYLVIHLGIVVKVHSEAIDFPYPPNISGFRMMFLSF